MLENDQSFVGWENIIFATVLTFLFGSQVSGNVRDTEYVYKILLEFSTRLKHTSAQDKPEFDLRSIWWSKAVADNIYRRIFS